MAQKVVSRTQRRMERKQAVILVLLVLVVSLASFSLGVMVGRSGSEERAVVERPAAPLTLPKPAPGPVAAAPSVESAPRPETTGAAPAAGTTASLSENAADKLTFYDTLPRGEQPIGSGINLPPEKEKENPAPVPVAPSTVQSAPPPAPKPAASVRKPVSGTPSRVTSTPAGGGYVVQIASFKKPEQARDLRSRLAGKGYVTFVQSADLGNKGVWHRVYAGPYTERGLADKAAARLHKEEKFAPLVRKR